MLTREQLEAASLEVFQQEAIKLHLPFTPDREALVEAILSIYTRRGPTASRDGAPKGTETSAEPATTDRLRRTVEALAENVREQQQEMLR